MTSAIWRIFAELYNPSYPKFADKHALSKMNLHSNIKGGKHVFACFKLGIVFGG